MWRSSFLLLGVCALFVSGCGDEDGLSGSPTTSSGSAGAGGEGGSGGSGAAGGGEGGGGSGGGIPTVDVVWEPCSLFSDGTGPEAECARPDVPLRAGDATGETIPYHVKRYSKPGSSPDKQLWLLSGGPGASSIIYEQHAQILTDVDDSLEIYMPDHRGTGDSSRLGCPGFEKEGTAWGTFISPGEWPKCLQEVQDQWGEDLAAFNVTSSAHDLGVLIESTRRDDARVFVLGASYGTFWGQRYLQMFPEQADGVILDAIAPPLTALERQDIDADETSVSLFEACAEDAECAARLGGDPRAFGLALFDKLDAGHCPGIQTNGPGRILLRRAFGQMMMSWSARELIPAAIFRADRCDEEDVDAVNALLDFHHFSPSAFVELMLEEWGFVLSHHIALSELWQTPDITADQMAEWRDNALVSRDVTESFTPTLEVMPRYPHDAHYGGFADSDRPLLMLQGTWDPATRLAPAEALKEAYTGPRHHWVEIPRGAHGALNTLPTMAGTSCGTEIILGFLEDPESAPDTSCLSELAPITFEGYPPLNMLLFGVEDVWGEP